MKNAWILSAWFQIKVAFINKDISSLADSWLLGASRPSIPGALAVRYLRLWPQPKLPNLFHGWTRRKWRNESNFVGIEESIVTSRLTPNSLQRGRRASTIRIFCLEPIRCHLHPQLLAFNCVIVGLMTPQDSLTCVVGGHRVGFLFLLPLLFSCVVARFSLVRILPT